MANSAHTFRDQVVIITGGSSGNGKATARRLLAAGARVTIASHDPARLEQTRAELRAMSPQVEAMVFDVRRTDEVERAVHQVQGRHGHIDIVINNAGYAVYRPFEESDLQEIVDLVDVNLSGAMRVARAALPGMIARRSGRIVNVSSIGGATIITPNAVYCAAKHGMVAWTKALRYELAPFGLSANVVCPGHATTHFHDHPTFRRRDPYRRARGRSMDADTVAAGILDAIARDREVTYVPRSLGFVTWALAALPFITRPVWNRIARRRIAQLYEQIDAERAGRPASR
ncbi:MAG: SDR family NAD(P)-dependent oxidoreductase [Vicinamibacterales bacterium]